MSLIPPSNVYLFSDELKELDSLKGLDNLIITTLYNILTKLKRVRRIVIGNHCTFVEVDLVFRSISNEPDLSKL